MENFSVGTWLESLYCGQYTETFISNKCTTKEAVSSLTAQQLEQWGIDCGEYSAGGKRILEAVERINLQSEEEAMQECLVSNMYTS